MSHPEIRVQYNAINAVIAAGQEILIKSTQPVAHDGHGTYSVVLISSCPEGAPFSQRSLRKSVACYFARVAASYLSERGAPRSPYARKTAQPERLHRATQP